MAKKNKTTKTPTEELDAVFPTVPSPLKEDIEDLVLLIMAAAEEVSPIVLAGRLHLTRNIIRGHVTISSTVAVSGPVPAISVEDRVTTLPEKIAGFGLIHLLSGGPLTDADFSAHQLQFIMAHPSHEARVAVASSLHAGNVMTIES